MKVKGEVIKITSLAEQHICDMYALMQRHYDGVEKNSFREDLSEKDNVVILYDSNNEIVGFSTQKLLSINVNSKPARIVFSGDTIIKREYWGTTALPITWGKMMMEIKAESSSTDLYWFLISKGYRTYRFLPVYFKDFYPRKDTSIPAHERDLISTLSNRMFPGRYDPEYNIVRADNGRQRLKPDLAEIPSGRLKNQDIDFFVKTNPGYSKGDELACIAKFDHFNVKPYLLKRIV